MIGMTATDARKGFFELLRGANERHEIYRVQHRGGNAIILSETEYEALIETLELLSVPGFRAAFEQSVQEAAAGETLSFEDVFGTPQ